LLQYAPAKQTVNDLLRNKKLMYLPLFDCPPATGQGAIVVETVANNDDAIYILNKIKDTVNHTAIQQERILAAKYGYGCSQQFGAFHIDLPTVSFTYAAGNDIHATPFTEWDCATMQKPFVGKIFATSNYMKDFFTYQFNDDINIPIESNTVFIASHKAIHSHKLVQQLANKNVWAAGTKSWLVLAKQGVWVQGSADGLGIDFIEQTFNGLVLQINPSKVLIITNAISAINWQQQNRLAIGTYTLQPILSTALQNEIAAADNIFWTSFQQYQLCKPFLKPTLIHYCLPGRTATLLQQQGIEPIIFPSIKACNLWMNQYTISINEG
jgi:hydroxymethylbilane synthase